MKQAADKFTRDAFDVPRRGRRPIANPKSGAQRAADYRSRRRAALASSDASVLAAAQVQELERMRDQVEKFRFHWSGLDERTEDKFKKAADALRSVLVALYAVPASAK